MSKIVITKWLIILGSGLLVACIGRNPAEDLLKDYVKRIETATGIDSQAGSQISLTTYPSRRDRALPMADIRVGLRDFLRFMDCEVFGLINERNSTLGKIMPISKRLVYEIDFLKGIERCHLRQIEKAGPDKDFIKDMEKIIALKRTNLANIFWNATFDSPEMQKAFSLAVRPLRPDENDSVYSHSRQAIDYFNQIGLQLQRFGSSLDIDSSELESYYYDLQLHQYGGRLLQSLVQLTTYLNKAAYSLEAVSKDSPLCDEQRPTQEARLLENVFVEDYGERIQPYLSQIHQQGQGWLDAINQLMAIQKVQLPEAFANYHAAMLSLNNENGLWHRFESAIHRHSKAWQVLLGQCGWIRGA